jgi:hypothetical protein
MKRILKQVILAVMSSLLAVPALAQNTGAQSTTQQAVPPWVQRGIPGAGHNALIPLVGSWRVEMSIYGTMGHSPDLPPIISNDIRTTRVWIADGQYIEDTTEGTVEENRTGAGAGSDTATLTAAMNG